MSEQHPEERFSREWEQSIVFLLEELLEKKHLYQHVRLRDPDELATRIAEQVPRENRDSFRIEQIAWATGPWSLSGPHDPSYLGRGGIPVRPRPSVHLPDLKIHCHHCDRIEAYNPLSGKDCVPESVSLQDRLPSGVIQVFAVSFLCQSCKSFPEFFLLRREGLKLTLSGRTPIEHVAVPKVIPKQVARFFSDAVVAHQSGQTLAGLFLLRTLIEQWVRSLGHSEDWADAALESYARTLPEDFKSRFPSLANFYGLLSTAIHAANPSVELFDDSLRNLELHFDARRLFNLSNDGVQ